MIEEIRRMREMGMCLADIKRRLDNNGEGNLQDTCKIDFLAERVAKIVKTEISVFLRGELNKELSGRDPHKPVHNIDVLNHAKVTSKSS